MTVTLQPSGVGNLAAPYYTGLSTDSKPVPAAGRATFFELDTGNEYVLADGHWWLWRRMGVASGGAGDQSGTEPQLLIEVLKELRKIRHGIEHAVGGEIPDPGDESPCLDS